jgi:hypothetical protein
VATTTLVTLAALLGGCGGGSSSPSARPSSHPTSTAAQPVVSTVRLGRVAGNLHQPNKRVFAHHRKQALAGVGKAVDSWIDGGFVGVSYPRDAFASAFRSFTSAARADATHQRQLLTNWDLRKRIDGVDVRRRTVTVDVLAPHGRPAGATAHVALVFATSGHVDKRVAVHARLYLTPGRHGRWQIFGYDVAKGDAR